MAILTVGLLGNSQSNVRIQPLFAARPLLHRGFEIAVVGEACAALTINKYAETAKVACYRSWHVTAPWLQLKGIAVASSGDEITCVGQSLLLVCRMPRR